MNHSKQSAALFGALIADAAALGLHWIYDPARIADVATEYGSAAFVPINAENFKDVPAYFAHAARVDGMQSQYGEVLRLAISTILANDGFEVSAYQSAFAEYFGAGGGYNGYIDRPTRGTLEHIAADKTLSGIDDDQLPAIATLPAIVARYSGVAQDSQIKSAMEVTNVNAVAADYSAVFADVLNGVVSGVAVGEVLQNAAQKASGEPHKLLLAALSVDELDSVAYGKITGRACHLPMAMPLAFHIMARASDYADAVERNIRAGGDSCGRAIIIGSIMGAAHDVSGIPLTWALSLHDGKNIWDACRAVSVTA